MDQTPIPQQYTSPSNTPAGSQMGAFEAGDIILAPSEPKKKRKGLILAVLVVSLLILVGAAFLVFQNVPDDSIVELTNNSFNRYANYVLFGEEKDDVIEGGYDPEYEYFMSKKVTEVNTAKDFFERGRILLDKVGSFDDENTRREWDHQVELFNFLSVLYTRDFLNYGDIVEKYISDGRDATMSYINNYYNNDYPDNDYLKDLVEINNARGEAIVQHVDLYNAVGCLDGFELQNCFEQKASDEQKAAALVYYNAYLEQHAAYFRYREFDKEMIISNYHIVDIMGGEEDAEED